MLVALVILLIINVATRGGSFLQAENLRNLLSQNAYVGIIATSEGALDAKGVITHSPAVPFGVPAGRWQDPKSNEQLILAPQEDGGVQVFYAAKPGQPWQELKVDPAPTREKLTVSFKVKQPKPYVLSVTAEQKIRCRNPDGSVQTFVGGE